MLLLLVQQQGGTYIHLYSWDRRLGLSYAKQSFCSGQKLPDEDSWPVMLIPSTKSTSFTLVTETDIAVYEDILSSYTKRINLPLADQYPPRYENSDRTPLWTQWTKPHRHDAYNKTHDDICLVREDGVLRHYIIDRSSPTKIEAHYRPGNLGINVDKAFASLDSPPALGGGDVFIIGGNLCDGGVYHCPARSEPVRVQVIPNLAPLHDMLTINSRDHNGSKALLDPERLERIFLCTGRGTGHTAVSEVRYGLEAQIGFSADYEDLSTVSNVWTFPDLANGRLILLISHAQQTTVMFLNLADLDLDLEVAEPETCPGVELNMPTLAAASILNDFVIQITQSSVNVTAFSVDAPTHSRAHSPSEVVAAAVDQVHGIFVTGFKTSAGFGLQISRVSCRDSIIRLHDIGSVLRIPHAPTSMFFVQTETSLFLIVGTANGVLYLLSIDQIDGAKVVSQYELTDLLSSGEVSAVTSVVVLRKPGTADMVLLCGLRSGLLAFLELRALPNNTPPGEYCHLLRSMVSTRTLTLQIRNDISPRVFRWSNERERG